MRQYRALCLIAALIIGVGPAFAETLKMSDIFPTWTGEGELVIKEASINVGKTGKPIVWFKVNFPPAHNRGPVVYSNDHHSLWVYIEEVRVVANREKGEKHLMYAEYQETYLPQWLYRDGVRVVIYVPSEQIRDAWYKSLRLAREYHSEREKENNFLPALINFGKME